MGIVIFKYQVHFIISNSKPYVSKALLELVHRQHKVNGSAELVPFQFSVSDEFRKPVIYFLS